jgi:peptidoglycan/xylan/chitin deacetylase (PgdA/CDA1 family)
MIARLREFVNRFKRDSNRGINFAYYAVFIILLVIILLLVFGVKKSYFVGQPDIRNRFNKQIISSKNNGGQNNHLVRSNDIKTTLINKINPQNKNILSKTGYYQDIPILMYHYVEDAPTSSTLKGLYLEPEIFESQLQEINAAKYNNYFVSEIAKSLISKNPLPKDSLVLTFDDGYEDFYTNVYPLLKKYKIKATLYVIINALDKPGYLTKAQVREMAGSAYVEIGSHTFNHLDLKTLNNRKTSFEIVKSKKILENISGQPVLSFCYPYGRYNNNDLKLASQAGYLASLTTEAGTIHYQSDMQILSRLRPGNRSGAEFTAWLKSFYK